MWYHWLVLLWFGSSLLEDVYGLLVSRHPTWTDYYWPIVSTVIHSLLVYWALRGLSFVSGGRR
jgi:hypothetical protein